MYRFRKVQDKNVTGLSSSAKILRKKRNLVTMRFNMINWLLDLVCLTLVLIGNNDLSTILYLLTTSCGTPLVTFLHSSPFLNNFCQYAGLLLHTGLEALLSKKKVSIDGTGVPGFLRPVWYCDRVAKPEKMGKKLNLVQKLVKNT